MFWKRLSLAKKIFFAIALTSTLVILVMAGLIGMSMRSGFVHYLLQVEVERFDALEETLAEAYDPADPGWPELAGRPHAWHGMIHEAVGIARPRTASLSDQLPHYHPPDRNAKGPSSQHLAGPPRRNAESPSSQHLAGPPRRNAESPPSHHLAGPPRRNAESPPPRNLAGAPPRREAAGRSRQRPPRLASRICLLDADGNLIVGQNHGGTYVIERPIMPINASETAEPLGWISLSAPPNAPITTNNAFLRDQLWSLVIVSTIALLVSALAAFTLARQFLAPVRALAQGADALATGNYSARMPNDRKDEFGALIDHFNALAKSLEAARDAERQWITDTSHELQTPLSVLRAEIEAQQDNVRQLTPAVLAGLHASVMRLSHLVGDLNTLARTHECGFSFSLDKADLREIIEDSLDHARPGIEQAGLTLRGQLDETLPVTCDRHRVHQLLDNLLENARRYTKAPGEIVLAAKRDGDSVIITIDDTLPCPPDEAIEHLFQRFFRVEASRSREHGGSGLGLAICQAIVKAHGGTIEARASGLGGLGMTVRLPMHADKEERRSCQDQAVRPYQLLDAS